jgi:hypothetical protein
MIRKGSRYPARLTNGSRNVHLLTKGGRPIWFSPETQRTMLEMWLQANVTTMAVMVFDANAHWFELEVVLPPSFTGNATDGWTGDLVTGQPPVTLGLFHSDSLMAWAGAGEGWVFSPGRETPETLGNGWKKWFCRCVVMPAWWIDVMVDLTVTSDRYGKSITAMQVFRMPISLNYPYTPTEIADGTLEADLQTQFPGATVDVVSGPLIATAKWHTPGAAITLGVTMSGSNVTDVTYQGSTVGTGYPFAMPSQKDALATMLTSALGGDPLFKAVVMLHGDSWTITLPDLVTTGQIRDFILTISPDDPFPAWDAFLQYHGLMSAAGVVGASGNVRTPAGAPLQEAARAFARVGFVL